MEEKDLGKTSTGIKANVAALLSYVLGFITGIIFYILEKENKFVRFHAMQSIIALGGLWVLSIIVMFMPFIGVFLVPVINILWVVLWIILMIKAYQGERFKLPVIGDFAEKKS